MSSQSSYIWQTEPTHDPRYGWVFIEYRAPGDRSRPHKRPLKPWELDENNYPLPGLDPNQDNSGEQHDATPRASSSTLVSSLQNLSIHEQDTDNNNYGDASFDQHLPSQSFPNYSHTAESSGDSYGHQGPHYDVSPQSIHQSSGKGKGRSSSSRSINESGRSTKSSSHHDRSSHRKPSSSREASVTEYGGTSQYPTSSEEIPISYSTGGDLTGTYPTFNSQGYNSQGQSPYGLPSVPETGMPVLDATFDDADDAQTEVGGYKHFGDEAGPSTGLGSYSSAAGAPNVQSAVSRYGSIPRGPGLPSASDPRFKLYRATEFKPGRVFKIEWPEARGFPTGINGSEATEYKQMEQSQVSRISKIAYWTWRRFIVIRAYDGFCHGIPIYTYRNQGCAKPGCKPDQHGIIYDERNKARMTRGEPPLGFPPVRIKIRKPNEQIHPASRVNYCKSTTIEYNLMVSFVGEIVGKDFRIVQEASDEAWKKGNTQYGGGTHNWPS